MDWGKLLSAANLSVNLYQAGQLAEINRQSMNAELRRQLIEEARSQIFRYRQLAETVLTGADSEPRIAATAIRILELRLHASGLSADVFSEFSDKEYATQVIKLIRDASSRLLGRLDITDQTKVEQVAQDVMRLPDYEYFIAHDASVQQADAAKSIMTTYEGRNGCMFNVGTSVIYFVASWIFLGLLFMSGYNQSAPSSNMMIIFILVNVGMILLFRFIRKWQNNDVYTSAKKQYESIEAKKIDMARCRRLRNEFRDVDTAQQLYHDAQQRIRQMFGDEYVSQLKS